MISPKDIEKKLQDNHAAAEMPAAEAQIDRELEHYYEKWSAGTPVKVVLSPPVHRLTLDLLRQKYSGKEMWSVEIRSSKNTTDYDALQFLPFKAPVHNEL